MSSEIARTLDECFLQIAELDKCLVSFAMEFLDDAALVKFQQQRKEYRKILARACNKRILYACPDVVLYSRRKWSWFGFWSKQNQRTLATFYILDFAWFSLSIRSPLTGRVRRGSSTGR